MSSSTRLASLLATAALASTVAACQPMRMAVPADLQAQRQPVDQRFKVWGEGDLTFGAYRATDIHRGWTSSTSSSWGRTEESEAKQKYRFRLLAAGGSTDAVECRTVAQARDVHYDSVTATRERFNLDCHVLGDGGRVAGNVHVDSVNRFENGGWVVTDGAQLQVVSSRRVEGSAFLGGIVGYELRVGGRIVGAVELINGGAVWIAADAPAPVAHAAAVAAASLLLFEQLDA